ncbi:MAG: HAMP domain-containing protein, partial [Deinococcales bacterium]|nr:HAMP domain-containing protein [Deinococcales bacterium]
ATPARRERGARRRRGATDAAAAEGAKRRRGSLRSKLLSTAIIPVLLAIAGALAATWFTARPALYDQLLESARNPAIATAATLSSTLERAGPDGIDHLQLLETILITRQAFARQNLSFILATDTSGNPYSGSFLGGTSFPEESLALQNAVRERAVHAVQQGASGRSGWAEEGATSHVAAAGGQRIEIVAQPLMQGNTAIGAVVVGVTDQAVTQQVNRIVVNVLLFSLIPLLIAILIAAWRARRLTNNVLMLTRKADEISRGDLDEPVELRSNDELDDLSAALERMRVSMSGALERLRRRR